MSDLQRVVEKIAVELIRLVAHPDPAFICVAAGDTDGPRYIARVKHLAGEPAEHGDQQWLHDQLGEEDLALQIFYGIFNGVLLFELVIPRFKKPAGSDEGFRYFPLQELRTRSRERILEINPASKLADNALAFAEIPLSANLLCVQRADDGNVVVIEVNHDAPPGGFGTLSTVESLRFHVCMEPPEFLMSYGCYTRYADGKTDAQWIPIRYLPDARSITAKGLAQEELPDWWPS